MIAKNERRTQSATVEELEEVPPATKPANPINPAQALPPVGLGLPPFAPPTQLSLAQHWFPTQQQHAKANYNVEWPLLMHLRHCGNWPKNTSQK